MKAPKLPKIDFAEKLKSLDFEKLKSFNYKKVINQEILKPLREMRLSTKITLTAVLILGLSLAINFTAFWAGQSAFKSFNEIYEKGFLPSQSASTIFEEVELINIALNSYEMGQKNSKQLTENLADTKTKFKSSLKVLNENAELFTQDQRDFLKSINSNQELFLDFIRKVQGIAKSGERKKIRFALIDDWPLIDQKILLPSKNLVQSFNGTIREFYQKQSNQQTTFNFYAVLASIIIFFTLLATMMRTRGLASEMESSTSDIIDIREQVIKLAQQLQESAADIIEGNRLRGSRLKEVCHRINEVSQAFQKTSQQLSQAKDKAGETKRVSTEGANKVDLINNAVEELAKFTANLNEINDVMHQIDNKTAVVKDIAFRSTILSFNAGLEAERAGSHGRGFSVIADEVGNLSKVSGEQAKEINTLIKDSVARVKRITHRFTKVSNSANEKGAEAVSGFNSILKSADSVSEDLETILAMNETNRNELNRVVKSMDQINSLNERNKQRLDQFTEISSKLNKQSDELNKNISAISRFVLGRNDSFAEEAVNITAYDLEAGKEESSSDGNDQIAS